MVIIESTQKLLHWFSEKHSFNLTDNFLDLFEKKVHISNTPDADKASVLAGLEELVLNGVLKKATVNKKEYYILIRNLNSFAQTVQLSSVTSLIIYEILKEYANFVKNNDILPNPLQLTENDVLTALTILREAGKVTNK